VSYATVGNCPKCGAPVYAESPWWGVTPPPSRPSCACNPQAVPRIITSSNIILDEPPSNGS
jgi:hypothetical protein